VKVYGDYGCLGTFGFAMKLDNAHSSSPNLYYYGFPIRAFGSCQPNCTDTKVIETRRTQAEFLVDRGQLQRKREQLNKVLKYRSLKFYNITIMLFCVLDEFVTNPIMLSFGGCWNIGSLRLADQYHNTPLQFLQGTHSTCVQLFLSPGCTGESKTFDLVERLSADTPVGDFINIFPQQWQFSKSISLCGLNCIGRSLLEQSHFIHDCNTSNLTYLLMTIKGSANFSSSTIKDDADRDKLCNSNTLSEAASPTEGNNTDESNVPKNGNTEGEPCGSTALWITIVILSVIIGILVVGLAESFRRYRHRAYVSQRERIDSLRMFEKRFCHENLQTESND